MPTIPAVRSDLVLEAAKDHPRLPWVVSDPALVRRVRVDEGTAALLQALREPRDLADLAREVGLDEEATADMVERLERLNLLDTDLARALAADAEAARRFQDEGRREAPLLIREDARFTCTMCGSCCTGQNIGPVMDDVLEGLRPHTEALERATGTTKGLFFEVGAGGRAEPGRHVLCHSKDGACVFLDEEGLCRIHAAHGAEAKPRVCRLFPYELMATPTGISVSISLECRGYAEARRGRPLTERRDEIRALLDLPPALSRVRPEVRLRGGAPVPWSEYESLEEALHAVVDREGDDPTATLLAIRDTLRDRVAAPPDGDPAAEGPAALREDLDAFTEGLAEDLREMRDAASGARGAMVLHADALDGVLEALARLRTDLPRALRPPRRAEQRDLFRDGMHRLLAQKTLTQPLTVTQGLARMTLRWLLTRTLAIHRARSARRHHLLTQDQIDARVTVTYAFRTRDLQDLLDRRFSEAIQDLFHERLPALVAHAGDLPDPDRKAHIYKF